MCNIIPEYMLNEIINGGSAANAIPFHAARLDLTTKKDKPLSNLFFVPEIKCGLPHGTYDAKNKMSLPGVLVRDGYKQHKDKTVNDCYDYVNSTLYFFKKILKRYSIDDKGFYIPATIHYGRKYPNAFYDRRGVVFGDGDGEIFNSFVILDIAGHELAHGVVDHTAGLVYRSQSGALNESYADVFGSCIKQWVKQQEAKDADWIIGEGIFMPGINGRGIRDMKNPGTAYDDKKIGKDRQPSSMKDYYDGPEDQQGVHINSSIPNKIFCEFAISLGEKSYEKPLKIWYKTLINKLKYNSHFQHFVDSIQQTIIEDYGIRTEYKYFRDACYKVGLEPK